MIYVVCTRLHTIRTYTFPLCMNIHMFSRQARYTLSLSLSSFIFQLFYVNKLSPIHLLITSTFICCVYLASSVGVKWDNSLLPPFHALINFFHLFIFLHVKWSNTESTSHLFYFKVLLCVISLESHHSMYFYLFFKLSPR